MNNKTITATDQAEWQAEWNCRYSGSRTVAKPAQVLTENLHLLPGHGCCLDLACGRGANALVLARLGLETYAWDFSATAIAGLSAEAVACGVTIATEVRDVIANPPEAERFDVIIVSRFLHRPLFDFLLAALKSGGVLLYQTFCRTRVASGGPNNPEFMLDDNELLTLCQPLAIRAYRENALLGDGEQGLRNMAWLVGEKR